MNVAAIRRTLAVAGWLGTPQALRLLALLSLASVSELAVGHHSVAAIYDMGQTTVLSGELVMIDWRNPHVELVIRVDDGSTEGQFWSLQGPSPGFFRDGDFPKSRFESWIGNLLTVTAHPARSGPGSAAMLHIDLPDGAGLDMDPSC